MRKYFFFILLFLLAAPFAQAKPAKQDTTRHMLWEVTSQQGVQGYLLGAIHIASKDMYPLDDVYTNAFDKADVSVYELNYDSLRTKGMRLMRKTGFYAGGDSLKNHISSKTYGQLKKQLSNMGLPYSRFKRMKPWVISQSLPLIKAMRKDYSSQYAVGEHFYKKAKKDNKRIIALETSRYQLKLMSGFSPQLQNKYLQYALKKNE